MQRIFFIFLILIFAFCISCKKEKQTFPVAVHMQSQFASDNVIVFVDNSQVFGETITTNDVLSLAAITETQLKEGKHEIKVFVNSKVISEKFEVHKDLYLGIQYNRTSQSISIIYSNIPFMYD